MTMFASHSRTQSLPAYAPRSARRASGSGGGLLRDLFAATIMLAGVFGCGSLGYALFNGLPAGTTNAPEPGTAAEPLPAWVEYGKPLQMFALQSPEFGREARLYEGRRHRTGNGRQDVLTYGAAPGEGPFLRLSLYRMGSEPAPKAAFFVDLARQSSQAGLSVTRSAQPVAMATKFGSFETADVVLARGETSAACLAFRLDAGDVEFRISGFACGTERAPDRAQLACIIDRLDLISGSGDPPLLRFFTAAEQARTKTCAPRGAGARASWLDPAGITPALRNGPQVARVQQ